MDLENFPTSPAAKRMMEDISAEFYEKSYVGKWLFQVMGIEWDAVWDIIDTLPEQLFPETATWGLMYHEAKYHLPIRRDDNYVERRKQIFRKRDFKAPMNPYRMERFLNNVTDFEVYVADVNDPGEFAYEPEHPNVFMIYCMGEGTLDVEKIRNEIDRLKQSHTVYKINDLVRITIDHTGLERFQISSVNIYAQFPFWRCRILNGDAYLDGSEFLDALRAYSMFLGVNAGAYKIQNTESAKIDGALVRMGFRIEEKPEISDIASGGRLDFWQSRYLDGSSLLDGSLELNYIRKKMAAGAAVHGAVRTRERIAPGPVIISRNPAFVDGSLLLDGSKTLDSIYRKEEIEWQA